jgi:hypothetical protein
MTVERGWPLPRITHYVVACSPYAYAVPALALCVGIAVLRGPRHTRVIAEIILAFAYIAAFAWVLLAIWSWQIARVQLIDRVRI